MELPHTALSILDTAFFLGIGNQFCDFIATYYTIVTEVLGEKWLTNKWLRLGTSRLANMLLSELKGEQIKFF